MPLFGNAMASTRLEGELIPLPSKAAPKVAPRYSDGEQMPPETPQPVELD